MIMRKGAVLQSDRGGVLRSASQPSAAYFVWVNHLYFFSLPLPGSSFVSPFLAGSCRRARGQCFACMDSSPPTVSSPHLLCQSRSQAARRLGLLKNAGWAVVMQARDAILCVYVYVCACVCLQMRAPRCVYRPV
jgi:hypothetical protein